MKYSIFLIAFLIVSASVSLQALEDNLTLFDQHITESDGKVVEAAAHTITAGPNYLIDTGADVTFVAGDEIKLNPGFTVINGAMFKASTDLNINTQLEEDTTFSDDQYISGTFTVPAGITLTVTDGTQLIFISDDNGVLIVSGSLNASGTTFTSSSGSWNGLRIQGSGYLYKCTIENARQGVMAAEGSSVIIDECTFLSNLVGIHILGGDPLIKKSLFDGNVWYAIKEDASVNAQVIENVFHNNGHLYYHKTLTNLIISELNNIEGNWGNIEQ